MATKKQAVTLSRVMKAVEADTDLGFCLACGAEQDGCEPDAREYHLACSYENFMGVLGRHVTGMVEPLP